MATLYQTEMVVLPLEMTSRATKMKGETGMLSNPAANSTVETTRNFFEQVTSSFFCDDLEKLRHSPALKSLEIRDSNFLPSSRSD